jgi:alkylation response protein AidB-like acyl-CoA dehydrogenase
MNLELSDEQVALRDTVRRVVAAEGEWDRTWKLLAELGAIDLLVPEADGGSGLGMVEAAIVAEELGRGLFAGPWAATAVGAVRAGGFVPGSRTAAVALPWPGQAPAFELDAGGRVRGEQRHVLGAPLAEVLLLPARRGDELVLVAVEGVDAVEEDGIDPTTAIGAVAVDGAAGEVVRVLGPAALDSVRDDLIVVWAADALGCARAVLDIAVEHAKVRHQFGQPVGAFQAVQHLLVDMLETVELAAGGVLHAAWAADHDPDGAHVAALRCKAFADRLATVGDAAIQVLGGIGYTWEHDAHRYLRRLLTWSAAFGPASSFRTYIGRALVGGRP